MEEKENNLVQLIFTIENQNSKETNQNLASSYWTDVAPPLLTPSPLMLLLRSLMMFHVLMKLKLLLLLLRLLLILMVKMKRVIKLLR